MNHRTVRTIASALLLFYLFPSWSDPRARLSAEELSAREQSSEDVPLERKESGKGKRAFSGIYPHLASFNQGGECGIGAVVPWGDKIWWVTYSPHKPRGSSDLLYAADEALNLFTWPGSVGGTPANHRTCRRYELQGDRRVCLRLAALPPSAAGPMQDRKWK